MKKKKNEENNLNCKMLTSKKFMILTIRKNIIKNNNNNINNYNNVNLKNIDNII